MTAFLHGRQRFFVFALAAENFADVNDGAGILRVGFRDLPIFLESFIELIVVEQCLGQRPQVVRVFGVEIGGALVGINRVLGSLQLVVDRPERELHLGRALGHWDRLDDFCSVGKIAVLGIEAGEIEDHFFRIGIDDPGRP